LSGIGFLLSINVKYEKRVQKLLEDVKEKNIELEGQKNYIEKIHNEITDSIKYAKRIQQAMLPPVDEFITQFNDLEAFLNAKSVL
jgi:hypothetical protein